MAISNSGYTDILELLCDRKFTPATYLKITEHLQQRGKPTKPTRDKLAQLKAWGLVVSRCTVSFRPGKPDYEYSIPEQYRPHLARIINEVRMLTNLTRTVEKPAAPVAELAEVK
jgi:hypothetical protein